jgi:peptidoglycan hydrolase CwlO-like protein
MTVTVKSKTISLVRPFFVCLIIFGMVAPFGVRAQSAPNSAAQQADLQSQYDQLQKEIGEWQGILNDTKAKANSLQGDVTYLNAKIKEAQLEIKQKQLAIAQLAKQISVKNDTINLLTNKISKSKKSLAQLIRQTNQIDAYSLPQVMLDNKNLSDFFSDLDTFASIQSAMHEHLNLIDKTKRDTEKAKAELSTQKDKVADAQHVVELKKQTITATQTEKKQLLAVANSQADAYQVVLAEKQKKAAAIRAALFHLRDTEGISFDKALGYANFAGGKTGVRPALILAILTQESDLGKNQGSCLVKNLATGDGVGKNSGTPFQKVMKAPRDTTPFQNITSRLSLDWKNQPVSCPPGYTYSSSRGYGGGMGPSQFIPSTWELFKDRIGAMIGVAGDAADPWSPQDAFVATGIYLSDLGASGGSFSAERNAACKYYSGASCQPGRKPSNVFYGDQVMQTADSIQNNIDFLKGV